MALFKPTRRHLAIGVAVVIALAIMASLAWGFGQQLALARQMRAEEERLEQAVATEQARNDALKAQLAYVKSDEYVEYWARTEARMVRQGEVAVVLLVETTPEPTVSAQPAPSSESEAQSFWAELWEIVSGLLKHP